MFFLLSHLNFTIKSLDCPLPICYNGITDSYTKEKPMIEIYLLEQLAAVAKYGTL